MMLNSVVAIRENSGEYWYAILLSKGATTSTVRRFEKDKVRYQLGNIQTAATREIIVGGIEMRPEWSFTEQTCIKGWRRLTTLATINWLQHHQRLHWNESTAMLPQKTSTKTEFKQL